MRLVSVGYVSVTLIMIYSAQGLVTVHNVCFLKPGMEKFNGCKIKILNQKSKVMLCQSKCNKNYMTFFFFFFIYLFFQFFKQYQSSIIFASVNFIDVPYWYMITTTLWIYLLVHTALHCFLSNHVIFRSRAIDSFINSFVLLNWQEQPN